MRDTFWEYARQRHGAYLGVAPTDPVVASWHDVEQTLCELARYVAIRDGRAGEVHVARRSS